MLRATFASSFRRQILLVRLLHRLVLRSLLDLRRSNKVRTPREWILYRRKKASSR